MAYPYTESGYNMYDMFSMMQKSIRRGLYDHAAFSANQLKNEYRNAMWNRLLVISAEDCYGIITKEIISLRENDLAKTEDSNIENAIALMCRAKKNRDACYFACNFVLTARNPRNITVTDEEIDEFNDVVGFDEAGFQITFSSANKHKEETVDAAKLVKAIRHRDCDMSGFYIDRLRESSRSLLWDALEKTSNANTTDEIIALRKADSIVNKRKKEKDEIFTSKACILSMYSCDEEITNLSASEIIRSKENINWKEYRVKELRKCNVERIPKWVYDCHTLKGKREGKTDWDMTIVEQEALRPKQVGYFDSASWIYTYEDDYKRGLISVSEINLIREYALTHEANPVKNIEY